MLWDSALSAMILKTLMWAFFCDQFFPFTKKENNINSKACWDNYFEYQRTICLLEYALKLIQHPLYQP